jgi:hypothetical protein
METIAPKKETIHTITIRFTGPETWSYDIMPRQANPKKARIKRKDVLQWVSPDGTWTVFFKGLTPLEDGNGIGIASVTAPSGASAGGIMAVKPKTGDVFTYGVKLVLNGSGQTVEDDPEIVIEA